MAKYSIDTVGLQLGMHRVAGEGAVLAEQARKFGEGGAKPTWGSHPEAGQVKSSWDALITQAATGATRLNGAVQRKANAVVNAAAIIDSGDTDMADQSRVAASQINDKWGSACGTRPLTRWTRWAVQFLRTILSSTSVPGLSRGPASTLGPSGRALLPPWRTSLMPGPW